MLQVELLNEEMQQILYYFDWRARWWRELGTACHDVEEHLHEGLTVYASKQAQIISDMASHFADLWYPELARSGVTPDWPPHYMSNRTVPFSDDSHAEAEHDADGDTEVDLDLFD